MEFEVLYIKHHRLPFTSIKLRDTLEMKQFYVPGFRAKGTEVTMDYDSKYSFIYKHEDSLKTRRQQDRCDKKKN